MPGKEIAWSSPVRKRPWGPIAIIITAILIFLLTKRGPPYLVIHLFERCFYPLLLKNNYLQWSFSRVAYNLVVLNFSSLLESA